MKASRVLFIAATALLFGTATALAADTSSGTTSGGTTSGTSTSSTSTTSTSGGTSTGSMGNPTGMPGSDHGPANAHDKANPHTVNPNASATAQAVQTILQKFDAARDQEMANRQTLIDQLKAATTDADKAAIKQQIKAEAQADKAQRAQIGKEIRDELKTLHEQKKGGG